MKRILFISTAVFVILVLSFVFLKHVSMWQWLYKSNSYLDKDANGEIKTLLLNVMKDQHSALADKERHRSELYSQELFANRMQSINSYRAKSVFVIVNHNFMDSVTKESENEYKAVIQLIWPDDWTYYFRINAIDKYYYVSDIGIDP